MKYGQFDEESENIGKTIFYRHFDKGNKDKNLEIHTRNVVSLCKDLIKRWPRNVDQSLVLNAAWLHDVAKTENREPHYLPPILKEVIKDDIEITDMLDSLLEIIAQHKKGFMPVQYPEESVILRICDKVDKFRQANLKRKKRKRKKGIKDARKKCRKTIKKYKFYAKYDGKELYILRDFCKKHKKILDYRILPRANENQLLKMLG